MKTLKIAGIVVGIVGFSVLFFLLRRCSVRNAKGEALEAKIESRGGRDVLVLDDKVCTGGKDSVPDCDLRRTFVGLPDGKPREVEVDESSPGFRLPKSCSSNWMFSYQTQQYSFSGTPPRVLAMTGDPAPVESPDGSQPALFTRPYAIEASSTDGTLLVLDEVGSSSRLVRIELRGPQWVTKWSQTIGGECQFVTRHGDVLVLATKSPANRAVGLDVATGAIRWRVGYD